MEVRPDYISEATEAFLLTAILDEIGKVAANRGSGRNRVLRYGYDYSRPQDWTGELPQWIPIPEGCECDNLTINEYLKGQSIAPHLDSHAFGDIWILSLAGTATMRFTKDWAKSDFELPRRSLAIMSGQWRTDWKHSILPIQDERRYSVIYRKRV